MNRRKFFGLLATTAVSSVVVANSNKLVEERDELIFKPESELISSSYDVKIDIPATNFRLGDYVTYPENDTGKKPIHNVQAVYDEILQTLMRG